MIKLVLHIDEQGRWDRVIGNLANLAKAKQNGKDIDIELVVTGDAILNVLMSDAYDQDLYNSLAESDKVGFKLRACHNSLNKYNTDNLAIFPFFKVVPAGLVEIGEREAEGYGYVKP